MLSLRNVALALSLIAHVALIWFVAHVTFGERGAAEPAIAVELVRLPPPPPPPPPPPKTASKSARIKGARLAVRRAPPVGPPLHYFSASGDTPATPGVDSGGITSGPGGAGSHTPSDYEEKVKARVIAAAVYPQIARLQKRQCAIGYTLTVDRQGNLVSYTIDPCTDEALNDAARKAIQDAAPYPPPPAYSGETYEISGQKIFRLP